MENNLKIESEEKPKRVRKTRSEYMKTWRARHPEKNIANHNKDNLYRKYRFIYLNILLPEQKSKFEYII